MLGSTTWSTVLFGCCKVSDSSLHHSESVFWPLHWDKHPQGWLRAGRKHQVAERQPLLSCSLAGRWKKHFTMSFRGAILSVATDSPSKENPYLQKPCPETSIQTLLIMTGKKQPVQPPSVRWCSAAHPHNSPIGKQAGNCEGATRGNTIQP